MTFHKYSSIENSYKGAFINRCSEAVGDRLMVATEKVDGANFQVIITKDSIKCARRSDIIDDLESFYNHKKVMNKYMEQFKIAQESIQDDVESIHIYGELFGGFYKGQQEKGAKAVQNRVNYHPDNEFIVFDIMLVHKSGESEYLPYLALREYIFELNITSKTCDEEKYARLCVTPVVAVGTLKECLETSPEFFTLVPYMYGMYVPDDLNDSDMSEGFIIRGFHEDFRFGETRVIIKQKSKKFSEKNPNKKVKVPVSLDEDQKVIFEEFCEYLTESRVHSVISKMGELTKGDFGKVTGMLIKDAAEDFSSEKGADIINRDDWGTMAKLINKEASTAVRGVWVGLDIA